MDTAVLSSAASFSSQLALGILFNYFMLGIIMQRLLR